MKKLVLVVILILGLGLCFTYILIPSGVQLSCVSYFKCISKNASDCINDTTNWKRWWPSSNTFTFRGYKYKLIRSFSDGAEILITKGKYSYQTRMRTIAIGTDSTAIEWQINYASGVNPIHRLKQSTEISEIKKNTDVMLGHLKSFVEKTENIYGFDVRRTTFTDTLLAAIKFSGKNYPTVKKVYALIRQIKTTLSAQEIEAIGFPMLNVNKIDSMSYETMIAIPVNKKPMPDKKVFVTRMVPMKDRFLFTEVMGGPSKIQKAHKAIDRYMNDHFLSAPAIPFEILVTDRSEESDTSKWKTIIYYPSM